MLRVSRLTDYATLILARMAREPSAVHTASDLAEMTWLGRPTVAKLLKQLVRGGLLTSYRGAHGGYLLARAPQRITAAQIIETVEGPVAVTECSLDDHQCGLEEVCQVGHHWQRINRAIHAALEDITLADLAAPASIPLRRMDLRGVVTGEVRVGG
jgi:FeS assembly SUF system regulator